MLTAPLDPIGMHEDHVGDPAPFPHEPRAWLQRDRRRGFGSAASPHYPSKSDPTYGDNVFVLTFNSANGKPVVSPHIHGVVDFDSTDYQIKIPGTLQDEEDPDFCLSSQEPTPPYALGQGFCPGQDGTSGGGSNYTGGRWFFTLNGQQFPDIPVKSAGGEIWRITNASGSATYDLRLWNAMQKQDMIFQVLSVDGVGISPTTGATKQSIAEIIGYKATPLPCPGLEPAPPGSRRGEPLCTTRLLMMPSTRAEIWVAYRNAKGALAVPPAGAQAIFRTAGFNTGPDGDTWPAVGLGAVLFEGLGRKPNAPMALSVDGDVVAALTVPRALASDLLPANVAVGGDPTCNALPQNHKRRIFFNVPTDNPDAFGLGYEEVDEHNISLPATFMDVKPFDPMRPTVCLPLGSGNSPVTERWELVNLAGEDHNFHMHQVRFRVLSAAELDQTSVPHQIFGQGVLMDSVPLTHADGVCASVDDWRKGACKAHPVTVDIPFAIAGDFVYHCHILEHEDGGMMARIRVRPNR